MASQVSKANQALKLFLQQITDKLLVASLVLMTLIPICPAFMPIPTRDPGVFLYVGWRILNGELPYRDVWDHKPPVIYYLNALGLVLTGGSRWGVWILEFLFLFFAALICFYLLKKIFGFYPAVTSLLIWLLTLPLLFADGNFTNEYPLPIQFLAFWLFLEMGKNKRSPGRWFLLGLTGAIAFFTKQTTFGIWFAIFLISTLERLKGRQVKPWLMESASFLAGGAVVSLIIFSFFAMQGGLGAFWDVAFRYNFAYLSGPQNRVERLIPILMGIDPLTESGLFQFGMIGYGIGLLLILSNKETVQEWKNLLLLGLIDLPLEFILANISGRVYPHYYISLLPVLALFAGLTFWVVTSQLSAWNISRNAKSLFSLSIIVIFLWSSIYNYTYEVRAIKQVPGASVVNYIETHTSRDDYVLIWGAEAAINFYTGRRSPTPYIYQYPLYTKGYVKEEMILAFLDDILQKRPRLIIDTKNGETPMFQFPLQTTAIAEKISAVKSHYHAEENIGDWTIYIYSENNRSP